MNNLEIRPITELEIPAFITTMFMAAGRPVDRQLIEEQAGTMDMENSIAAFDGDELVGTVGTRLLNMNFPGGKSLPMAAIGQGGVLPSHSGQGIMRKLMIASFDMVKKNNIPLAAWTTSAWPLYERYGGGVATFGASYTLHGLSQDALRADLEKRTGDKTRFAGIDEAYNILPELHREAVSYPGGVSRDKRYWGRLLDRLQAGKSLDVLDSADNLPAPMFCINKNPDGKIDGCCLYRIHQKWDGGIHQSQMQIISFLYTNQDAAKSLWSFLSGSGMIRSISMPHARIDEPLRWMLKDGRSLQQEEVQDHIWLRVMDPVEVLRNRGFQGLTKEFSIAVNDSTGITESVTLKIQPKGSFAEVHITDEQPDIEMDIGTLSSLVLGGNSVWTFAEAGRFKLHSEDALNNAACAFSAGPVPFCDNSY